MAAAAVPASFRKDLLDFFMAIRSKLPVYLPIIQDTNVWVNMMFLIFDNGYILKSISYFYPSGMLWFDLFNFNGLS